jgi:hypothetical protein
MPKSIIYGMAWIVLVLNTSGSRTEDIDPERAIDLFEGATRAIRYYDVHVSVTMRVPLEIEEHDGKGVVRKLRPGETPRSRREFSRQVFDRGRGRIQVLDRATGKAQLVLGYDGEVAKIWNPRDRQAVIQSGLYGRAVLDGGDYRDTFRNVCGGLPLDLLVGLRQRKGYVVAKNGEGNSPLVILEALPLPRSRLATADWGKWKFRIGLDPRRAMMPAFIERYQPQGDELDLYRCTVVNEWKAIGNGLWAPICATTQIYYLDNKKNKELNGLVANETVLVVDVAHSSWNIDVPPEALRVAIPVGTAVTDRLRKVHYVTGKADPGQNLADLAAAAREIRPYSTKPAPWKQTSWGWLLFAVFLPAVAMLIVLMFFLRKRRFGKILW